jgi:UDP-glucose 4-epimerase
MEQKIVVIGSSGFIGRELLLHLQLMKIDAKIIPLSSKEIDLTNSTSAQQLNDIIDQKTIVFICAGIKKQLGDNLETFEKNVLIVQNCLKAEKIVSCQKTVFLSSAEVYGENINNLRISEKTPCSPSSYYGLAKKNSEELMQLVFRKAGKNSLIIARMPLVYGPRESQNIYGPSGFTNSALIQEPQLLWGDGTEKRNFLFVDDLVDVLFFISQTKFSGIINIANSKSNSFQDIINSLAQKKLNLKLDFRPRTKEKVDQGYDISILKNLYPSFKPHSLQEGLDKLLTLKRN